MGRPATPVHVDDSVSVVLCGEAGQGIQTIEQALAAVLKMSGYHVFSTKEYMSRVRGGCNSTSIRIASRRVAAPVKRIDLLVALAPEAMAHLADRIDKRTLIVGEKSVLGDNPRTVDLPLTSIAAACGNKLYSSSVAVGYVLGVLGLDPGTLETYLRGRFGTKGEAVVSGNVDAARKGHDLGRLPASSGGLARLVSPSLGVNEEMLLNGGQAVALGAIAAGCNFVSSYPMSPSTVALTEMAAYSHEFGVVVEQAEDEIAAINMCLGAWYAGARALVTTSGGGFALMGEGLSLAGSIETPIVIHLAQRPGPATGLPTRTEQGDLNLALYAGHGEFARVIFAPGTLQQAYDLTQRAFSFADTFQIPAFILTDQYLVDSYYNIPPLAAPSEPMQNRIVRTDIDYRRYALTRDGVSPRGVPGFGAGVVRVDSDEHTEDGLITEDRNVRNVMVRKRLARMDRLRRLALRPERVGPRGACTLVVTWGTNYHALREALERAARPDIAMLHFAQVYPLNPAAVAQFAGVKRVVVVENNATAQFASLLGAQLGVHVDKSVLKYDGHPFTVEEMADVLDSSTGKPARKASGRRAR